MFEITSTTNNLVKETVKLHQKKYRDKYILIEGKKSVDEVISLGLKIKYIFTTKEDYKNFETYFVNEAVIKKVSTTESAPSVIAVVEKPIFKIEDFKKYKKIVLLDNIKDAGNLGTIIRASSAFGVDGIMLIGDTVDEFSPKTIRASAGNMFKIPIIKINLDELKTFKKTHKFLATVCHSKNYESKLNKNNNLIVMFGSEADGLSDKILDLKDEEITIKMTKNVESLNLALSAGVILYELQR